MALTLVHFVDVCPTSMECVFFYCEKQVILHKDHMKVQLFHMLNDLDRPALKQLLENISVSECLKFI